MADNTGFLPMNVVKKRPLRLFVAQDTKIHENIKNN